MKRFLILFSFLLIGIYTPSAYRPEIYILAERPFNEYDALIKAIVAVESSGDTWALNVKEQATGAFQIRPVRIQHYNRLTSSNYKIWDCFDYELSRKIFLYFCKGRNYEQVAKSWNGSGYKTKLYWQKIKSKL